MCQACPHDLPENLIINFALNEINFYFILRNPVQPCYKYDFIEYFATQKYLECNRVDTKHYLKEKYISILKNIYIYIITRNTELTIYEFQTFCHRVEIMTLTLITINIY